MERNDPVIKERIFIIKRTVVEEFQVTAANREEALKKGPDSAYGPSSVRVIKETCVPSPDEQ